MQAVKWYRLAADQGNADAQYALATMYDTGDGLPKDVVQAVKWYRLAADQGNADAQLSLGVMYDTGKGVPRDHVQAHKLFSLAGASGSGHGLKLRDLVATKMTPAQIAEAQRLAHEWKPKQ